MDVAIGDIHGKKCWKEILNKDFNHIYFVGDYFDCFELISTATQIKNFKEICEIARKDDRIKLCFGNHDFHYMRNIDEQYSGYQYHFRFDIQEAIEENIDLLNLVYIHENILISHAGITKTWLKSIGKSLEQVNDAFRENRYICIFDGYNCYGDDITQSPIWVRPNSLLKDKVDGYSQIVGHTRMNDVITDRNITFIDCLDTVVKGYIF